ncbi:uncharacterized protein LOC143270294 [Peromyscus maniculatus bairdii]|uniref:uncharacterized protein LOC143270294 n=1 Tax=Peromyscus maniculatus bairdii TaxID=230844 RepID=UPI003FD2B88A
MFSEGVRFILYLSFAEERGTYSSEIRSSSVKTILGDLELSLLDEKSDEHIGSAIRSSSIKTILGDLELSPLDEVEKKAPCDPHITVRHNLVHLPPTWDGEGVDPVDNKKEDMLLLLITPAMWFLVSIMMMIRHISNIIFRRRSNLRDYRNQNVGQVATEADNSLKEQNK